MTLGQWYHALKCLALGKYHTKFQLSSPKGMKVISCKRNADVKLHLNLQVRKLEPGYECDIRTYARTDVTSRRNATWPTPAFGGGNINTHTHTHTKQKKKQNKKNNNNNWCLKNYGVIISGFIIINCLLMLHLMGKITPDDSLCYCSYFSTKTLIRSISLGVLKIKEIHKEPIQNNW